VYLREPELTALSLSHTHTHTQPVLRVVTSLECEGRSTPLDKSRKQDLTEELLNCVCVCVCV